MNLMSGGSGDRFASRDMDYGNVDSRLINPPPFNGLNYRIPIIAPIKGRGLFIGGLH